MGGCVGPVGLYVAFSGSGQRFPRCEGQYQVFQGADGWGECWHCCALSSRSAGGVEPDGCR